MEDTARADRNRFVVGVGGVALAQSKALCIQIKRRMAAAAVRADDHQAVVGRKDERRSAALANTDSCQAPAREDSATIGDDQLVIIGPVDRADVESRDIGHQAAVDQQRVVGEATGITKVQNEIVRCRRAQAPNRVGGIHRHRCAAAASDTHTKRGVIGAPARRRGGDEVGAGVLVPTAADGVRSVAGEENARRRAVQVGGGQGAAAQHEIGVSGRNRVVGGQQGLQREAAAGQGIGATQDVQHRRRRVNRAAVGLNQVTRVDDIAAGVGVHAGERHRLGAIQCHRAGAADGHAHGVGVDAVVEGHGIGIHRAAGDHIVHRAVVKRHRVAVRINLGVKPVRRRGVPNAADTAVPDQIG